VRGGAALGQARHCDGNRGNLSAVSPVRRAIPQLLVPPTTLPKTVNDSDKVCGSPESNGKMTNISYINYLLTRQPTR
jgi:hypothetical protein